MVSKTALLFSFFSLLLFDSFKTQFWVILMRKALSPLRAMNRISATNSASYASDFLRWSKRNRARGIPQKSRLEVSPISVIHDSKKVLIAGRNRCNNFNCNSYVIVAKETGDAVMIDCGDDWCDDWVTYLNESAAKLHCVAFTHLHVDNLIGFAPFCAMMGGPTNVRRAFNPSDSYWLTKYRDSCLRYGRGDVAHARLPLLQGSAQDILLSSATSRCSSFIRLGDTMIFYIHTPGHSMGHTVYHIPQEKLLFSGDLIFFDNIGRIDLPQASGELLAQSLRVLEELPDNTVVLPGHGRMTTLGRERRHNKGLQRVYEWMAVGKTNPLVGANEEGWL